MNGAAPRRAPADLRRFKPYPEYKDSGVEWLGEVPAHWEVIRLAELTTLLNGYPFDSEYFVRGDGTPLVRIRDLYENETEVNYIGPAVNDAWIAHGDVIIGMDGDFNVARWKGPRALLNQRMCCLRPRSPNDGGFIAYILPFPLKVINDLTYSTTVKHLSSLDVRKIRVGSPPREEQRDIAAFLDRETARIDALVAKKKRLIELLQEKRAVLITRAVTKGLDPNVPMKDSGAERLGEVPAHWEVYALRRRLFREAGSIKIGPFGSQLKLELMTKEGFKVYGQEHVIARDFGRGNKYVDLGRFTELAACEIRPYDLVVTMMGSSGRCAVVPEGIERGIMDSHLLRVRLRNCDLDPTYLCLLIDESAYVRDQIEASGKGAIMLGLNSNIIKSLLLAVPPASEQRKILSFLDRETAKIDALIAKVRDAVDRLNELSTALISAAVTGRIDVRGEVA